MGDYLFTSAACHHNFSPCPQMSQQVQVMPSDDSPNQKFSCEHSGIEVGRPAIPRQIFVGQPYSLSWAHGWHMWRLLRETSHKTARNILLFSDYRSGIVPPKTAIYCWSHCGKFPSIKDTYASMGPQ